MSATHSRYPRDRWAASREGASVMSARAEAFLAPFSPPPGSAKSRICGTPSMATATPLTITCGPRASAGTNGPEWSTTLTLVTADPRTSLCGVSTISVSRWFQLVDAPPKHPRNATNDRRAITPTIRPNRIPTHSSRTIPGAYHIHPHRSRPNPPPFPSPNIPAGGIRRPPNVLPQPPQRTRSPRHLPSPSVGRGWG